MHTRGTQTPTAQRKTRLELALALAPRPLARRRRELRLKVAVIGAQALERVAQLAAGVVLGPQLLRRAIEAGGLLFLLLFGWGDAGAAAGFVNAWIGAVDPGVVRKSKEPAVSR